MCVWRRSNGAKISSRTPLGCKVRVSIHDHASSMHLGKLEIVLIILFAIAFAAWLYLVFMG